MLDSHLLAALAAPDLTGLPRQEVLYQRLKAAILDGRLPGGGYACRLRDNWQLTWQWPVTE